MIHMYLIKRKNLLGQLFHSKRDGENQPMEKQEAMAILPSNDQYIYDSCGNKISDWIIEAKLRWMNMILKHVIRKTKIKMLSRGTIFLKQTKEKTLIILFETKGTTLRCYIQSPHLVQIIFPNNLAQTQGQEKRLPRLSCKEGTRLLCYNL